MINASQNIKDILASGSFEYANLVKVNLGDAYDYGYDHILYLTDFGHNIDHDGNTYVFDHNLTEMAGISRKASTGSDSVDLVFSVTNSTLIEAIESHRYINKPSSIERVIMVGGNVVEGYSIPIRTAWGLSHSIDGDIEDRSITLTIDSSLGDLKGDNGWYAINASHMKRHAGDQIMKHSGTVMTEDQRKKYTTNFKGIINSEIKPPALPKIYGYKNVEPVPILQLKHRKTHTMYRHYFTTWIYVVSIGECEDVDTDNLQVDGEPWGADYISDSSSHGGTVFTVLNPSDNNTSIKTNTRLNFWRSRMDSRELARLDGMYGKGLTLLFVRNRNRDDWKDSPYKISIPVKGAKVYDPRTTQTAFSRNPALQYADFLKSSEYGAGTRGITVDDTNISELADHFDQIPDSIGFDGIDSIYVDAQIDTGKPLVDNMNVWMQGVRLFTSDYYGKFAIRVETKSATVMAIDEGDLLDYPTYESGDFTDRLNQITYTVKQLVPDTEDPSLLVEVDVEATFPEDGTQTHTDWLAEDGGMPRFESQQLDHVTELEQAYYWAMVDARISRMPRTLELPVGAIGWLLEVGDVITYTSSILNHDATLWRVDEVSEDEHTVLTLRSYDDTFYVPEPNAIPAPIPPAQPPTANTLDVVADFNLIERQGNFYLDWTHNPLADWYAIEIQNGGSTIVADVNRHSNPPYLLPNLVVGAYSADIIAIYSGQESEPVNLGFTMDVPLTPTAATIEAFGSHVTIRPDSTGQAIGTRYHFFLRGTSPSGNRVLKIENSMGAVIYGLEPETEYFFSVLAVNPLGVSGYYECSATTAASEALKGDRGAGRYYADTLPSPYDWLDTDTAADALAVTACGGIAVVDDIVTLFKSGDRTVEQTRRYDGVANGWVAFAAHVHGDLLVDGTVYAEKVKAGAIRAEHLSVEGGSTATNDKTSFQINPNSDIPLHYKKLNNDLTTKEDIFYVTKDGDAFFAGNLAKDTVDIKAIDVDARKAINQYYAGVSDFDENATLSTSSAPNALLSSITTVGGKAIISWKLSASKHYHGDATVANYTKPVWKVQIRRNSSSGSIVVPWRTYTGTATNFTDQEDGATPWSSRDASLNIDDLFIDENAPATEIYHMQVARVSGTPTSITRQLFRAEAASFIENTMSRATIGYWIDKDTGLIIQWGTTGVIGNGSPVNFPFTFPNKCCSVTATANDSSNLAYCSVKTVGLGSFVMQFSGGNSSENTHWMAIGY